jgi:dTDP-4-dehydrorhamnose reductase
LKTILVTGSNGLLGQKIIYALRNHSDVKCIAASRGENRIFEKNGYIYESLEITDNKRLKEVFDFYRPHVVINTAAMTNVDACETKKEECIRINVDAVASMVQLCEQYNTHFVQVSTDFVFDGEKGPYVEEDETRPLSFYADSKHKAELLLQQSKISWAILRTIIIYGVVDDNSRSNIVLWAKNSLEKKQTIRVINDQFRSPTLAEDLADACVSAALKKATGIYHVSGRETMCLLDLVKIVADYFQLDASLIQPVTSAELNQPAKRPPVTGFIISKAIRNLDFHPHTFLEGLAIVKRQLDEMN